MKTIDCIRGVLMASVVFFLLPHSASAYLQEGGSGAPLGKLNVPLKVMVGHCTTMVSPNYPQTVGGSPAAARVIVRVVIWKSGSVSPLRVVSGPSSLEDEAMNTVRLWRYKPFARDGEALDVTTDIEVDFDPAKPGGVVTHPNQ